MIRVLIVDDHEVVRRGVRSLLSQSESVEVCGEAVDGRDAIAKAKELHPDVITMDVSMPNLNGLEATREIRRILPDVHILILSQHDVPEMMQQALNAGARGYVVKTAISTELVAALDRVKRGGRSFNEAVFGSAQAHLDTQEILQRSAIFEKELQERDERLRMAQQVARVGMFEWNIKTGVDRWSPELEAMYGLPPGGFPGTQSAWEEMVHPDDRQQTLRAVERALQEGSFEKEWRVIWPDGSVHWLLGRAWVFKDHQGRPERFTGVNIDITERKLAEHALLEKAHLLDMSSDAILVRDAADRITFWNEGATEMYGYTREQALGRVSHELFCTKFPESLERINEKLLRDAHWGGELIHTRGDSSKVVVSSRWSVERDSRGNVTSILETNRDISEQAQADQAQYRLAAIVESSDDAIVSKDLDGTITSWNTGAQRILLFTTEEAIGQSITIIIPPELRDEERQILGRLRAGERIDHFETIRQAKSGARLYVSLTISPVRDARGRIVGASKIARDITERKRIEQAVKEVELSGRLLQLQDEERRRVARELHDGVGQLLAALSMNAAAVVNERSKLSPVAARCAQENADFIAQAVAEIRTLSHLLHPPFLDEVGLKSALTEYVHGFGERSNIRVTLDLPRDLERLPRDYELSLFRIVQECLTNIHRHSGSPTALVRLSRIPGEIQLEVTDQGRGIPQETQQTFVAGGSTGVGLCGMRERVRQMGGGLQIHSNENGTSVLVVLPLGQKAVASTESGALAPARTEAPPRKSAIARPHLM